MKNEISPYLEVLVTFMMGSLKSTEGVQVRKLSNSICLSSCQYIYWYIYIDFDLQWVLWTFGFFFFFGTKLDTLQRRWGPSCHLQWRRPMWWGGHFSRRWRWWWGWWRPENPRVGKAGSLYCLPSRIGFSLGWSTFFMLTVSFGCIAANPLNELWLLTSIYCLGCLFLCYMYLK